MLRRILSCCVAALLLFPLLPALADGPLTLSYDDTPLSVRSQCLYQGELLALAEGGLYALAPGDSAPRRIADAAALPGSPWLVAGGDRLYGFYNDACLLEPLTLQDGTITRGEGLRLQNAAFEDPDDEAIQPEHIVLADDVLYALYRPQSMGGYKTRMVAWRLADGQLLELKAPEHLQAIAAYRDGLLLGLHMDAWAAANAPDPAARQPGLIAFDPLSGSAETLGKLEQPLAEYEAAFAWDTAADALLYLSDSKLYRRDASGAEALCAHLPRGFFFEGVGDRLVPLPDDRCAVLAIDSAVIYPTVPLAKDTRVLTLYGNPPDFQTNQKALKAIPGVPVSQVDTIWQDTAMLLGQMVSTGAADYDVMFLTSERDELARLIDKGYLMDLSGSPAIRAHLDRCDPLFQQQARRGDAVYLVPVHTENLQLMARPALFEQTGLSIPATFEDVCRLLTAWADDKADRFQGINALGNWNEPLSGLYQLALRMNAAALAKEGAPMAFDTPLLRRLIGMAQGLDIASLNKPEGDYAWYHMPSLLSETIASLGTLTMYNAGAPEEHIQPVHLQADSDTPPVVPVRAGYIALSTRSQSPDAALRFVEGYIAALSPFMRIKLYPDENEPINPPGIEDILARLQAEEDALAGQLKTAGEDDRHALEQQLNEAKQRRLSQEAMRYSVSPEEIALYRHMMQHAVIEDRTFSLLTDHPELAQLFSRFREGQISLDQFISEADGKLRLMRLEDE